MDLIPLFPLHTVLYPDAALELRIFEPRYVDMVSECLHSNSEFGVSLITDGAEVGAPATCRDMGTAARIVDFSRLPDGLLGIVARGVRRFRAGTRETRPNGLQLARVQWLEETARPVAPQYESLKKVLRQLEQASGEHSVGEGPAPDEAARLGYRLADLLPLDLATRQELLELPDPDARLERILSLLQAAQSAAEAR